MKKILYLSACLGLVSLMSGCSCGNRTSCQPFKSMRTKMQSWCQGDQCDTCCPPAGQPTNFGTNVAPLCDSCDTGTSVGRPVYSDSVAPGVQLYDDPNLNAPMSTPIYDQPIENPAPVYNGDGVLFQNSISPGQVSSGVMGTGVASDSVTPPNF